MRKRCHILEQIEPKEAILLAKRAEPITDADGYCVVINSQGKRTAAFVVTRTTIS